MSKTHRGSVLKKEVPHSGRGYCKVTKRSGVKLLYDYEFEGQNIKVSKLGRAILENSRKAKEKHLAQVAASAEKEPAQSTDASTETA